jgi:hypothetical protein
LHAIGFIGKPVWSNYTNAPAPAYIVNGAAGNREGLTGGFVDPAPAWVAARYREYGFGKIVWSMTFAPNPTPPHHPDEVPRVNIFD